MLHRKNAKNCRARTRKDPQISNNTILNDQNIGTGLGYHRLARRRWQDVEVGKFLDAGCRWKGSSV
jgi:hypothetical protein